MTSFRTLALATCLLGSLAGAHAATQSFNVFAQANSTAFTTHDASPLDTGLVFDAGSALHITASGTWNGGGCGDVGPSGTTCFGNDPVTGFNYFSLIGKVGDGAWFRIADAYDGVAAGSGDLFLAFLDTDSFNNSGFVTAVVTTAVPEPASWALMLGGAGALLGIARRRSAAVAGTGSAG
jgi:hypothetical protein